VRAQNQDHLLVRQIKKQMEGLNTNLPNASVILTEQERLAMVAMVGDRGEAGGGEASRVAVKAVTQYLAESIHVY
jgi:hypothetical protein